ALAQLPKMLQDAGATISLQNTFVRSSGVDANMDGKINATAASPLGGIGKVTLSIKGLDETIQKMQSTSLKPGADPHMLGYLGAITIVQLKGQLDKAADGKSLRNYLFELTPEGKLLLNGQDVNAQPALPPAQPAPAQSTPAPAPEMPHSH